MGNFFVFGGVVVSTALGVLVVCATVGGNMGDVGDVGDKVGDILGDVGDNIGDVGDKVGDLVVIPKTGEIILGVEFILVVFDIYLYKI